MWLKKRAISRLMLLLSHFKYCRTFARGSKKIYIMNKIQELTEKLYHEGLSKGQQEADIIIAQARTEAEKILSEAQNRANEIETTAKKQAAEIKANTDAEIKLAGKQIISEIKQSVENMILTKAVSSDVKHAFDEVAFVRELIRTATERFNPHLSNDINLFIIVPEGQKNSVSDYLASKVSSVLSSIEIYEDSRMKSGFKIGSKDEGFYIGFTDEDFDNLFKTYLRPKVSELLFG
jgi:V/A-type H+-transporting ATPase subunit E